LGQNGGTRPGAGRPEMAQFPATLEMKATFELARAHALLALARTAKSRAYVDVAARVTELRGDPERVIEKAAITMAASSPNSPRSASPT
jgi:hypothetical protein